MFEILPLYVVCTFLAYFSHIFSGYDPKTEEYHKKEHFFYGVMIVLLVIFAGTRLGYNDTWVYKGGYEDEVRAFSSGYFASFDWTIGSNPGFHLIESLLKTMGFNSQAFLMFFSIVTIIPIFWFVKKYSNNIFYSMILAFLFLYVDTLAAIKQMFATALCLIAVDRFLQGKKIRFVVLILVAMTIHPYAVMYFAVPFLTFTPWTRKTWYLLIAFGIFGLSFQFLSGRIIALTSLMGEEYTVQSLSSEGMNPLRVVVRCVPILLSVFVRDRIKYSAEDRENNLFLNLSMISGELSFVALFGTALLIGRISNYFMPFQVLSLPWLFKYMDKRYRWIVIALALILYFTFFVADAYLSGNDTFDNEFSRMTFFEFIEQGIYE